VAAAAFFDIDHTLIAGDSGMLFIRFLLARGELRRHHLARPLYYTLLHRLNLLDIDGLFDRYAESVRGQAHAAMTALCGAYFETYVLPAVYPHMATVVRQHQARGDVVVLLSSATNYVAEPLAHHLGIEHLLVNRLPVHDGHLTGEASRPLCYGAGKRYWAERFATEQGIDLGQSYFYADSASDLPALAVVGFPRAVNPDRLLRRHARRRGWPIVAPTHAVPRP